MGFPAVAEQTSRLFGLRVGAAHQDVSVAADVDVSLGEATDFKAGATYCKAKKTGEKERKGGGDARKSENKFKGDGQVLNGFKRRTSIRNRCFGRDSKYTLAPKRTRMGTTRNVSALFLPRLSKVPRPPYSSISMDFPVSVQPVRKRTCEQSFPTTLDLRGRFPCMGEGSVVGLETGATANSACPLRLGNRKLLLGKRGFPRVSTYSACKHFKFGVGRLGGVLFAADTPVGLAGCARKFASFVLGADIPALGCDHLVAPVTR